MYQVVLVNPTMEWRCIYQSGGRFRGWQCGGFKSKNGIALYYTVTSIALGIWLYKLQIQNWNSVVLNLPCIGELWNKREHMANSRLWTKPIALTWSVITDSFYLFLTSAKVTTYSCLAARSIAATKTESFLGSWYCPYPLLATPIPIRPVCEQTPLQNK